MRDLKHLNVKEEEGAGQKQSKTVAAAVAAALAMDGVAAAVALDRVAAVGLMSGWQFSKKRHRIGFDYWKIGGRGEGL